jgi:hypothetical protein
MAPPAAQPAVSPVASASGQSGSLPGRSDALVTTHQVTMVTAVSIPRALDARWRRRFRAVGVLTPVVGFIKGPVKLSGDETVIGRSRHAAVSIADDSVSRRHARIVQRGEDFVLEDLESRNGTFLDGMPIASCILRTGDEIQIGRNLFYFDRLLEPVGRAESALSSVGGAGLPGAALPGAGEPTP